MRAIACSDVDVDSIRAEPSDVCPDKYGFDPARGLRIKSIEILVISRYEEHSAQFGSINHLARCGATSQQQNASIEWRRARSEFNQSSIAIADQNQFCRRGSFSTVWPREQSLTIVGKAKSIEGLRARKHIACGVVCMQRVAVQDVQCIARPGKPSDVIACQPVSIVPSREPES